jgi:hypothetical protein
MNVTSRWASTQYQTTNYGLGGLCETHLDPHGYLDDVVVPDEKVCKEKSVIFTCKKLVQLMDT